MAQSLRRQRVLFERTLQKLVNNKTYIKTDNGYKLTEPFPDGYSFLSKPKPAAKQKRNIAEENQSLDEILAGTGDSEEPVKEFDDDLYDSSFNVVKRTEQR